MGLTEASWCAVNAYPGLYCAAAAGSSDCAPRLHSSAGTLPRSASAARVDTHAHSQANSMTCLASLPICRFIQQRKCFPLLTMVTLRSSDFGRVRVHAYIWSHLLQHEEHSHLLLNIHLLRRLARGLLPVHPPCSWSSTEIINKTTIIKIQGKTRGVDNHGSLSSGIPRMFRCMHFQAFLTRWYLGGATFSGHHASVPFQLRLLWSNQTFLVVN